MRPLSLQQMGWMGGWLGCVVTPRPSVVRWFLNSPPPSTARPLLLFCALLRGSMRMRMRIRTAGLSSFGRFQLLVRPFFYIQM